jgi:hypothetical protein
LILICWLFAQLWRIFPDDGQLVLFFFDLMWIQWVIVPFLVHAALPVRLFFVCLFMWEFFVVFGDNGEFLVVWMGIYGDCLKFFSIKIFAEYF